MKFPMAILTAFALLPSAGWAMSADQPDPADPNAAVPPFTYESAFHGYAAGQHDAEVSDWRGTGFDRMTPGEGTTGQMRMQAAPAPLQKDNGGPSGGGVLRPHGMRHK